MAFMQGIKERRKQMILTRSALCNTCYEARLYKKPTDPNDTPCKLNSVCFISEESQRDIVKMTWPFMTNGQNNLFIPPTCQSICFADDFETNVVLVPQWPDVVKHLPLSLINVSYIARTFFHVFKYEDIIKEHAQYGMFQNKLTGNYAKIIEEKYDESAANLTKFQKNLHRCPLTQCILEVCYNQTPNMLELDTIKAIYRWIPNFFIASLMWIYLLAPELVDIIEQEHSQVVNYRSFEPKKEERDIKPSLHDVYDMTCVINNKKLYRIVDNLRNIQTLKVNRGAPVIFERDNVDQCINSIEYFVDFHTMLKTNVDCVMYYGMPRINKTTGDKYNILNTCNPQKMLIVDTFNIFGPTPNSSNVMQYAVASSASANTHIFNENNNRAVNQQQIKLNVQQTIQNLRKRIDEDPDKFKSPTVQFIISTIQDVINRDINDSYITLKRNTFRSSSNVLRPYVSNTIGGNYNNNYKYVNSRYKTSSDDGEKKKTEFKSRDVVMYTSKLQPKNNEVSARFTFDVLCGSNMTTLEGYTTVMADMFSTICYGAHKIMVECESNRLNPNQCDWSSYINYVKIINDDYLTHYKDIKSNMYNTINTKGLISYKVKTTTPLYDEDKFIKGIDIKNNKVGNCWFLKDINEIVKIKTDGGRLYDDIEQAIARIDDKRNNMVKTMHNRQENNNNLVDDDSFNITTTANNSYADIISAVNINNINSKIKHNGGDGIDGISTTYPMTIENFVNLLMYGVMDEFVESLDQYKRRYLDYINDIYYKVQGKVDSEKREAHSNSQSIIFYQNSKPFYRSLAESYISCDKNGEWMHEYENLIKGKSKFMVTGITVYKDKDTDIIKTVVPIIKVIDAGSSSSSIDEEGKCIKLTENVSMQDNDILVALKHHIFQYMLYNRYQKDKPAHEWMCIFEDQIDPYLYEDMRFKRVYNISSIGRDNEHTFQNQGSARCRNSIIYNYSIECYSNSNYAPNDTKWFLSRTLQPVKFGQAEINKYRFNFNRGTSFIMANYDTHTKPYLTAECNKYETGMKASSLNAEDESTTIEQILHITSYSYLKSQFDMKYNSWLDNTLKHYGFIYQKVNDLTVNTSCDTVEEIVIWIINVCTYNDDDAYNPEDCKIYFKEDGMARLWSCLILSKVLNSLKDESNCDLSNELVELNQLIDSAISRVDKRKRKMNCIDDVDDDSSKCLKVDDMMMTD